MLFNSMSFLVFFVCVISVYALLPARVRWVFLLAASYYFYMSWKAVYAILILTTTMISYLCALGSSPSAPAGRKKMLLIVSVTTNLGILFTFKYFNFVSDSLQSIFNYFALPVEIPLLNVLLPVGISFYTFQALSYTIDVYRGQMEPEKRFLRFAFYVSFFPQLVAGPIERATHLLPQLCRPLRSDWSRVQTGLQLMGWGLFKKVVIADRLALYVDSVYNNVPDHTGLSYIVATYFFAFQIYCDFSGYSDIAVGCARILGVDLMTNFNRPYFAATVTDFWRRWHISLSTWLRDYLYIPLGGNRRGKRRTYINLLVTMLLGGVWHGASWMFVIWGAMHGVLLCVSKLTLPYRDRLVAYLGIPASIVHCVRVVITFHLVCLSWVFFRANTIQDAIHILTHLFASWPRLFVHPLSIAYGVPAVLLLLLVQLWQTRRSVIETLDTLPLPLRWGAYTAVLFGIVLFGVDGGAQFIYFQF